MDKFSAEDLGNRFVLGPDSKGMAVPFRAHVAAQVLAGVVVSHIRYNSKEKAALAVELADALLKELSK